MQDVTKLKVWARSHAFTLAVYRASTSFPREELFGLTSQLRRAAASIPANLAEGCGRASNAELSRYTVIAMGSASEGEYHLLLAHDLGYVSDAVFQHLDAEIKTIKHMLTGFQKRLRGNTDASIIGEDGMPYYKTTDESE
jgi:four helix bundle protein